MKWVEFIDKLLRSVQKNWIAALLIAGVVVVAFPYIERHFDRVSYSITIQKTAESAVKPTKSP